MIKVPFVINKHDFSRVTVKFNVLYEVANDRIVTTQDGTEHEFGRKVRPIIEFTVRICREHTPENYRALLAEPLIVKYDDPDYGMTEMAFRLDCNLQKSLEIWNCAEEANYYSSGIIRLRGKEALDVSRI